MGAGLGRREVATDPWGIELAEFFRALKPRSQWTKARTQAELTVLMGDVLNQVPGLKPAFSQPIEMRLNEMIAGARGDITLPGDVRLAGKHIAILVANHKQSAKVRQALIERGIASASERRESVYSSDEAADLTLVLDALISRRDGLLRRALTTAL